MDLRSKIADLRTLALKGWREMEWLPITLARVSLGVFFCISGANKLFTPAGRERMLETIEKTGIPFPEFNAIFVSGIEFVGGGLLVIGLLSSVWAALLIGVMFVAIVTTDIHTIPEGLSPLDWLSYFFYLPQVLYMLILFWLLFTGPGTVSVDHLIAKRLNLGEDERQAE